MHKTGKTTMCRDYQGMVLPKKVKDKKVLEERDFFPALKTGLCSTSTLW